MEVHKCNSYFEFLMTCQADLDPKVSFVKRQKSCNKENISVKRKIKMFNKPITIIHSSYSSPSFSKNWAEGGGQVTGLIFDDCVPGRFEFKSLFR